MGTTSTFLKSRVSKPTVGKWSSGFSAVKKFADEKGIPLIGVWSNGDACGHCISFEKAVSNATFKKWMESSGCAFWFGCSSDTSKDDKMNGTGYTWAWKNQSLKMYPFVRVWWKKGSVDTAKSGDDWTGGSDKGYNTFIKKLNSLLKNFKPSTETQPTTPAESNNGCDGCDADATDNGCDGGCAPDCEALKKDLSDLRAQFESFKTEFGKKLDELQVKIG